MIFDCAASMFDARKCDESKDRFNGCDADRVNRHRIDWQRFDEQINQGEFAANWDGVNIDWLSGTGTCEHGAGGVGCCVIRIGIGGNVCSWGAVDG
jgi:hypothetical protein